MPWEEYGMSCFGRGEKDELFTEEVVKVLKKMKKEKSTRSYELLLFDI